MQETGEKFSELVIRTKYNFPVGKIEKIILDTMKKRMGAMIKGKAERTAVQNLNTSFQPRKSCNKYSFCEKPYITG